MNTYLVTVRLQKNLGHDPGNRQTGPCPVSGKPCTDVTGEHHTYLRKSYLSAAELQLDLSRDYHVTRIEEV